MDTKTFYLIRHAEPDFPGGEKICLGQKIDLPLSRAGLDHAALLARVLQSVPLDAVYTSPMQRAKQTAAPIAGDDRPLYVIPELIELHGGEWDGVPFSLIRKRHPDQFVPGVRSACPPGGESDEEGLARARRALERIVQQTPRSAAIVAHGGLNRLLLCSLLSRPLSDKKKLSQGYGAVSVLTSLGGEWRVDAVALSAEELEIRLHAT